LHGACALMTLGLVLLHVVPKFRLCGPGPRTVGLGPSYGMNKSQIVPCPPDGLVVRLKHDTSPVNRAVSQGRVGQRAPLENGSKPL
jgi:hypothetical protein